MPQRNAFIQPVVLVGRRAGRRESGDHAAPRNRVRQSVQHALRGVQPDAEPRHQPERIQGAESAAEETARTAGRRTAEHHRNLWPPNAVAVQRQLLQAVQEIRGVLRSQPTVQPLSLSVAERKQFDAVHGRQVHLRRQQIGQ